MNLPHNWRPRHYQKPSWNYLNSKRYDIHCELVHPRQHGKDDILLNFEVCYAVQHQGSYLHLLPQHNQVRKAIWSMINPFTGKRRIDERIPHEIRKKTLETEMKIILFNDSSIQFSGSDNYDALVGGSYNGVGWSEWALSNPNSSSYLEPILDMNGGYRVYVTTPRGRNHAYTSLQLAKESKGSFGEVLSAYDCGVYSHEKLETIKQRYIASYGYEYGTARFEQEYLCSFDAANLGAILARDLTIAEREGRVADDVIYQRQHGSIIVSSDLGHRDASTWWFWQVYRDSSGQARRKVIDCLDGWGIKAHEWCDKIQLILDKYSNDLGCIWLPHDGKAETASAENTWQETFARKFGWSKVKIVPKTSIFDRVNCARTTVSTVEFNKTNCKKGLDGLTSWSYDYDDEKKDFSDKPRHDWASHYGDGFSYGCQVMRADNSILIPSGNEVSSYNQMTYNDLKNSYNNEYNYGNNRRI